MRPRTLSPRNSSRSLDAARVLAPEVCVSAARSSSGLRNRYPIASWHSSRIVCSREADKVFAGGMMGRYDGESSDTCRKLTIPHAASQRGQTAQAAEFDLRILTV